jgi:hypothetical protein
LAININKLIYSFRYSDHKTQGRRCCVSKLKAWWKLAEKLPVVNLDLIALSISAESLQTMVTFLLNILMGKLVDEFDVIQRTAMKASVLYSFSSVLCLSGRGRNLWVMYYTDSFLTNWSTLKIFSLNVESISRLFNQPHTFFSIIWCHLVVLQPIEIVKSGSGLFNQPLSPSSLFFDFLHIVCTSQPPQNAE